MANITVRFELSFGAKTLRLLMAGGMLLSAASEVASESVSLTTYYPAPSGVYTQMITTNNSYLARDSSSNQGQVYVGWYSAAPTHQALDVFSYQGNNAGYGAIRAQSSSVANAEFGAVANRGGVVSAVYANQGAADYAGYFNGTAGKEVAHFVGDVSVTGSVKSNVGCGTINSERANCGAGQYITAVAGVYAQIYTLPFYKFSNSGGTYAPALVGESSQDALCCPCPAGGCTF